MTDIRTIAMLVLGLLTPQAALTHGEADWIMNEPGYTAANGSSCCGPVDCAAVAGDFARPVPGGWYVPSTDQTFQWGERGLYPSNDGLTLWRCQPTGQPVRCLFVPSNAS